MNDLKATRIAVIGLGYVGLPLARLFSTKYTTIGFDLNAAAPRILRRYALATSTSLPCRHL